MDSTNFIMKPMPVLGGNKSASCLRSPNSSEIVGYSTLFEGFGDAQSESRKVCGPVALLQHATKIVRKPQTRTIPGGLTANTLNEPASSKPVNHKLVSWYCRLTTNPKMPCIQFRAYWGILALATAISGAFCGGNNQYFVEITRSAVGMRSFTLILIADFFRCCGKMLLCVEWTAGDLRPFLFFYLAGQTSPVDRRLPENAAQLKQLLLGTPDCRQK